MHLRSELIQEAQAREMEKNALKNTTIQLQLDANKTCEDKVLAEMGELPDSSQRDQLLKTVTLEHFKNCLVPQLKAYCRVRLLDTESPSLLNLKKGSVEQASTGVQNLISLAHSFRERPVRLSVEDNAVALQDKQEAALVQPSLVRCSIQRSIWQGDNDFMYIVAMFTTFDLPPMRTMEMANADRERVKEETCQLTAILGQRFQMHVHARIEDAAKRTHWCLQWAARNLARAAALMVLSGHITDDLECSKRDASTCLLGMPLLRDSAFVEVDMDDCCVEGCYLYFDTKNGCWVRSGKAVGRKFPERHREHEKKAMLKDADDLSSRFYRTFPCRDAKETGMRRGYFDHLQLYCGLGFDRTKETSQNLLTSEKETSLFVWPSGDLKKLKSVNFRGVAAENLEERQRHMVGYLCELAYDLALSPSKNVSGSPGFETPLGVFGARTSEED
jgi:hypothetical protein